MDFLKDLMGLLQNGGWQAVTVVAFFFLYKTSMVSIIAFGIYKAVSRVSLVIEGASFVRRLAAELGVSSPLSAVEENSIVAAVREYKKNE